MRRGGKAIFYSHLKAVGLRTLGLGPIGIDLRSIAPRRGPRTYLQVGTGRHILRVRKMV